MIRYLKSAQKDAQKLDPKIRQLMREFLEKRVAKMENPRQIGEPLKGQLADLWRYRVGNYRIICKLEDQELLIIVIRIGHRKKVYKDRG